VRQVLEVTVRIDAARGAARARPRELGRSMPATSAPSRASASATPSPLPTIHPVSDGQSITICCAVTRGRNIRTCANRPCDELPRRCTGLARQESSGIAIHDALKYVLRSRLWSCLPSRTRSPGRVECAQVSAPACVGALCNVMDYPVHHRSRS
jgi:hypothetical protein